MKRLIVIASIAVLCAVGLVMAATPCPVSIDPNAWKFDAPVGQDDAHLAVFTQIADMTIEYYPLILTTKSGAFELVPDANGVYDFTDASIRLLCESGRVCEVMGHRWEFKAAKVWKCCVCGAKRLRSHGFWIYPKTGRILDEATKP